MSFWFILIKGHNIIQILLSFSLKINFIIKYVPSIINFDFNREIDFPLLWHESLIEVINSAMFVETEFLNTVMEYARFDFFEKKTPTLVNKIKDDIKEINFSAMEAYKVKQNISRHQPVSSDSYLLLRKHLIKIDMHVKKIAESIREEI